MADQLLIATQKTDRPAYRFRVKLDGAFYRLRLNYVSRRKRWHLDIDDDDGNTLADGLSVCSELSLLEPFRGFVGWPAGQLFAADPTGADRDPGRNDLRADIRLVYRPADDVPGLVGTDLEVF